MTPASHELLISKDRDRLKDLLCACSTTEFANLNSLSLLICVTFQIDPIFYHWLLKGLDMTLF